MDENERCFAIATANQLVAGLFVHPSTPLLTTELRILSAQALAYWHGERMDFAERGKLVPILEALSVSEMPIVVHLSCHGRIPYAKAEAERWLRFLAARLPRNAIVVSHCGGENAMLAIDWAAAQSNIFLDLSRANETALRTGVHTVERFVATMLAKVRPTQLLFGSDATWPAPVDHAIDKVAILVLLESMLRVDIESLLDENAIRVLRRVESMCQNL